MNEFIKLFFWEYRQVARQRLLWLMIALLGVALIWGAQSGATLVRTQSDALERTQHESAAWLASLHEQRQRYSHPAATPLPYWQDPTNISGFSRYYLRSHALKPHLPLATLSIGSSDLQPTRLPVKLETLFGVAPTYDFEPPRALALGRFDLGFVIVYLLPIVTLLLIALLATFERDHGMLRLIAAQTTHPRTWLGARIIAILAWLLPMVWLMLISALLLTDTPILTSVPELMAALGLVTAYILFWAALSFWVVASWPGAMSAISVLTAIWALLCSGIPLLVTVTEQQLNSNAAQISPLTYIDAQRRHTDEIEAKRDETLTQIFLATPELAQHVNQISKLDYATRLTFITLLLEQRLAPLQQRMTANRKAHERVANLARFILPPLSLQHALATLAGTDATRHQQFETQTRRFQLTLRDWFYTRVQREISHPTPRLAGSYARLNFTDYNAIPTFSLVDESAVARIHKTLPIAAWLLVLSALLTGLAFKRLRRWPDEV